MKGSKLTVGLFGLVLLAVLIAAQVPRWARGASAPETAEGGDPWVPLVYRLSPPGVAVGTNMYSDGTNVGIATTAPAARLDVNGTARIGGPLNMSGQQVNDVAAPAAPGDASNQAYVANRVAETTGILIPMYVYPANIFTNPVYNQLIALKKTYHDVPVYAILNPANGPGAVADGNYTAAIERLHGAGIFILGYVSTAYTARPYATVTADVDAWQTLYPDVDGIFFDEMTNDNNQGHVNYYQGLNNYAHAAGLYPTVGNPGAGTLEIYFSSNTADVIVIHENSSWPTEADLKGDYDGGYADYHYRQRAGLVYAQGMDTAQFQVLRHYLGLVYVTDDTLPNPWDTLSPHLETTLRLLSVSDSAEFAQDVVVHGDLSAAGGIILQAADGPNCFRLVVDNAGTLNTTPVSCP
ncbi:MAG: spherulation-specific family 4 protein [Anaerolineales bacterium]|nr:spherulation-specific family 4 protein [Anaerolineales bacterium]MCB8951677.1 spherulation-specific family 4 protein [Ardenticatenales bacterium]